MVLVRASKIITMDPLVPSADAMVVEGDRIRFVGAEAAAIRTFGSRKDLVFADWRPHVIVPGFNDNHLHLFSMGRAFSTPRIAGMSEHEIVAFLRSVWSNASPGTLLVARGWDYPHCPDPHRDMLDATFPDNPVVLFQFSGHGAWLNSRALRLFHIGGTTPDPEGGRIMRDSRGVPTGILTDDAVKPIHVSRFRSGQASYRVVEPPLAEALGRLAAVGVTSVQDNTWLPRSVGFFRRHRRRGLLTARVDCWSYGEARFGDLFFGLRRFDGNWVRRGPVKLFLDGTFSTRSAWVLEPYEGATGPSDSCGTATHEREWLRRMIEHYARRGRQVAVHAIGDGAVRAFVDAVEAVARTVPAVRDLRMRVEHGQLIHPDDISRMAELGILASAQPHAAANPEKDRELLGRTRATRAYPYRSLLNAGVPLSFGSDIPGEDTYAPLLGISLAVNREGPEAISAADALRAYTAGSAYAGFSEEVKGTLGSGFLADFTVLDGDPLSVPPSGIAEISVVRTVVAGCCVYEAADGYLPAGRDIAESAAASRSTPRAAGGGNAGSQNPTA